MNQEMQKLLDSLLEFRDKRDWAQFHTVKNLAISISLEAAELLEHFQWTPEGQEITPEKLELLSDEIADIFIYILLISHKLDIDPVKAAETKINKNKSKYPAELVKGKSAKYTEY